MLNKQGNKTESDKTSPCTAKPSQQQNETTATKFSNRKNIGTLRHFTTRISLLQQKTLRTNRQYSSASSSRHFNDHNQTAGRSKTILQGRNLLSGVRNSLDPSRSKQLQSLRIIPQLLPVTVNDHKPRLRAATGIAWKRDTLFWQ
jgi:hypothetical protein